MADDLAGRHPRRPGRPGTQVGTPILRVGHTVEG
jgi:hypothetical protein